MDMMPRSLVDKKWRFEGTFFPIYWKEMICFSETLVPISKTALSIVPEDFNFSFLKF
jgi:hypothetical protein